MQQSNKVYMILTNGFDPDVRVYKEAKYLVEKNFDVTILCWDRRCEYIDKEEKILDGIKIKRFFIPSTPGTGLKQLIPYFKFMRSVKNYLKNKEYNYLHCHDFDGIVVGMATKKKKKKQIIFDMHEIYNNYAYAKNKIFKKIFNNIIKKVNYVIYVNNEQIKNIEKKEKLVFLPNYPEQCTYSPIDKVKANKIRINYIGSLRDYESLKALAEIGVQNQNIEIGLYGSGICYDKLKKEYKDTPVKIYGKYDGLKDSGEIYRNTDILYCSYNPSIENWKNAYPVKLYEAIITLTPIIVTKDTAVGELVEKYKIGEVIAYNNIDSIQEKICKIHDNYNYYINNLKNIYQKYQWKSIVNNLDIIYKER